MGLERPHAESLDLLNKNTNPKHTHFVILLNIVCEAGEYIKEGGVGEMDEWQLSPEVRSDIARLEKERVASLTAFERKKWGTRIADFLKTCSGQSEEYQRQQVLVKFGQDSSGFWQLAKHLEELEAKPLNIEMHLDTILVGTITWCDAGATENIKKVTMEMAGSTEVWTLSWTTADTGKKVYTFRPDVSIARNETKNTDKAGVPGLNALLRRLLECV